MNRLDPLFGIHAEALSLQKSRMDILAANLANADTPNYQARDVDFASILQARIDGWEKPEQGTAIAEDSLLYRVPMQPSADGNTVDTQIEQAAFADASMHYQASLNFVDGRVKSMLTAITGQ
jgi:flagellar basal-body rod protein FlgB